MRITLPVIYLAALIMPSHAQAGTLAVPDLPPGSPYRLVFVTGDVIGARSADINTYNTFVDDQANNFGSVLAALGTTWKAIASTPTVSAFDNIGGIFADPIYLPNGTLVANGSSGLWSGSLLAASGIYIDQGGGSASEANREVWTGTRPDGSGQPTGELGEGMNPLSPSVYGSTYTSDSRWIAAEETRGTVGLPLYGISAELTVPEPVPEPGTVIPMLLGAVILVLGERIRRNLCSPLSSTAARYGRSVRQNPPGPSLILRTLAGRNAGTPAPQTGCLLESWRGSAAHCPDPHLVAVLQPACCFPC